MFQPKALPPKAIPVRNTNRNMTPNERQMFSIMEAIEAENIKAKSRATTPVHNPERERRKSLIDQKLQENNVSKPKVLPQKKMLKLGFGGEAFNPRIARLRHIQKHVKLTSQSHDIYSQSSLTKQQFYQRQIQFKVVQQGTTQTHEDDVSQGIQTDSIRRKHVGMCFPDDVGYAERSEAEKAKPTDSVALYSFLNRCRLTFDVLLEENYETIAEERASESKTLENLHNRETPSIAFAKQLNIGSPDYLAHRKVTSLTMSKQYSHRVFASFGAVDSNLSEEAPAMSLSGVADAAKKLKNFSLIGVWEPLVGDSPVNLMVSTFDVRCLDVNERETFLVFGCTSGALCLYDLRDNNARHQTEVSNDMKAPCLREICYTNALNEDVHSSPVVDVHVLDPVDKNGNCQVVSVDESGIVKFWIIVTMDSKESNTRGISDRGLRVGGLARLMPTYSMNSMESTFRNAHLAIPSVTSFDLVLGQGPMKMLAGFNNGTVSLLPRFAASENLSIPTFHKDFGSDSWKSQSNMWQHSAGTLAVHPHPDLNDIFAVGYQNGDIAIYSTQSGCPVVLLPGVILGEGACVAAPILHLEWSHANPSILFVCNSKKQFLVWDLAKDTLGPILAHVIPSISCSKLHNSVSFTIGVMKSNKQVIAFTDETGTKVVLHEIDNGLLLPRHASGTSAELLKEILC
eukprot:TRINITY_DN529_c0_g2_i1.p1 TRINITY_DN529_c0_g2~~TRINITY_DN529_c0_g2_i1.p1  ORF type:complete len:684 (+),score=165.15 TRINITY_DN529_c0_g2_i1:438-2489(+)